MQENFLITIKGTMEQRGDSDTVELMTRGSLVHKEGAYYIVYKETEATGYEGCTTTVKVAEDARKVSMLRYGKVPSQLLLQPAAIDLSAEEKQALLENQPLLENAGLDVADFGGSTVLLRAVPADVEPQNAEDLLVEIADRLLKGSRDALNEHTEWVLHSISCRAAIKAGDKSSPQELMALAEKILSGEVPPFCPHGRPCVLKLTRKELEKQFGRIV